MCQFFSFVTFNRKPYCLDWDARKRCLSGELNFDPDSHASIALYHEMNEDKCNKYEYNPLTGVFKVDQINAKKDDSRDAERWVRRLDWTGIVPALIIKPIVHPFQVTGTGTRLCKKDKELLAQWASFGDSFGASVWDSVGASVEASVRASVGASVWALVWASVWASVRAYIGSFFAVEELNKYQSLWTLWERGFVPSFDGKTWRLHHGPDAKIVYEVTLKTLEG